MADLLRGNQAWTPAIVAELEHPFLDLEEDYLDRLEAPAARHVLTLGLGGIAVEVKTDSGGLAGYLQDAFGPFLARDPPELHLEIGEIGERDLPFQTLVGTLLTYNRGSHVVGKFREMAGYVDTARGSGRALIAGKNYRQDLGNYLRLVMDAMAPRLGGVLFHTAAVAHRGKAHLFFGPSTAGKSTLSRLSALRHEIMTDDMLVLRLQQGQVRAATCGFWGGETRVYATKRTDLEVSGFFRLKKAASHRLDPLPTPAAAIEVLCGVPAMQRPSADRQRILDFVAQAVTRAPAYQLSFHKRDDSFWSLIDELD